jgi:predicted dehydrogenase
MKFNDPSRRDVLHAAGAGIVATSFTAAPSRAQSEQKSKKLGFAFVGVGTLTMNQLLPAVHKTKLCYPAALVSGHSEKAKQQAEKHGIDPKNIYSYENFDSIKDNSAIDVVYVVLPNAMHSEYTVRSAKAGKHVLCEKPMDVSSAKCREMIEACKVAKRKLMIAYRLRYEPNKMALIDTVQKKVCGDLKIIEAGAGFMIGDPNQWRLNPKLSGGGCLMDIGIYALNASRYISGEQPVEVSAVTHTTEGDPRFKNPGAEEHCNFELRFPSGVLASCTSSYSTGLNHFRANCTKGWAEVDPALSYTGVKFRYNDRSGPTKEPALEQVDHFAAEMDHFAECVMNDKEPRTPGEEGLRDLLVMEAIYESAKMGKAVKVPLV